MPSDHGPTYVDVEGIKWRRDGSVWSCWVAEQWVPAPGANPTGLVKVDAEAAIPTCGRCGEEVLVDGSFCGSCGANLRVWQDETPDSHFTGLDQEGALADPVNSSGLATDPFAWAAMKYCPNGHDVPVWASACRECVADTSFVVKKKPDPLYASKRNPVGQGVRPTLKPTMPPQRQGMPKNLVITLVVALVLLVGGGIVAASSSGSSNPNLATAGIPCSQNPACSGGSTGSGGSASSEPTSSQLSQAYEEGYFHGQHLNGPISFCQTSQYPDAQRNAQFQNGCGAAMGGGSSSSNYGGIPGNQGPSPTAAHVQPYSGGSYCGSTGGVCGAP